MKVAFENNTEKSNVRATIQRLIDTITERSITTAEEKNLTKVLALINATPIENDLTEYNNRM